MSALARFFWAGCYFSPLSCSCDWSREPLLRLLDPDIAVLHLPAVGFEADGAGLWKLQRVFEDLAVAGAMRDVVLHHHDDLVPVLRLVILQRLVRPSHEVVAALELRL